MLRRFVAPFVALASLLSLVAVFFATPAAATPQIAFASGGANPLKTSPQNDHIDRDLAHRPFAISYDDCKKDARLEFTIAATPGTFVTGEFNMQAWAGLTDCSQTEGRSSVMGTCQPVSLAVPLSATSRVEVRGRDLAFAASGAHSPPGNGGLVVMSPSASDDSACRAQTDPAGAQMNVVFLVFAASGASDAEVALTYTPRMPGLEIVVDTLGPPGPARGTLAPAPSGMKLTWIPAESVDTFGYVALCSERPTTCPSDGPVVRSDGRDLDPRFVCGTAPDRTMTTFVVDKLQPGTPYAFAVAAVDLVGNVGPPTVEGCSITGAASDTASDPNAAVKAGCACTVTRSVPGGGAGGGAAIAIVALAMVRRSRRARR